MSISGFNRTFGLARGVKAFLTRKKVKRKRREFRRISNELHAAKSRAERIKHKKRKKTVQQEIFQLQRELRAAEVRRTEGEPETGAAAPGIKERREAMVPSRRIGTPTDIADAVLFLASPRASYVNGAEILVDGGLGTVLMEQTPRPGF